MATKTVIKCMDQAQNQPGAISILIDQHKAEQQVLDITSRNSNIIKIQHSNEQQTHLTLNNSNKNNKTLIDINRNNEDEQLHYDRQHNVEKNDLVLQINCSTTSSDHDDDSREIKEMLDKLQRDSKKLEYNGFLTERRNVDNEVQSFNREKNEISNKYSSDLLKRAEEDEEESGQTASQHQQQQQQQQQLQQVNNNNGKARENGQNSFTPKLTDDNNEDQQHNDHVPNDHFKLQVHNDENNREVDNDGNDDDNDNISVSGSGLNGLVQRDVLANFSHAKRSLSEENSNSLLTPADASTTTCSKTSTTTRLTISANVNENDLNKKDFENLSNDLPTNNHVVKIQINPNTKTLTEKQITVVKIENSQQIENLKTTSEESFESLNNKKKDIKASENFENKENQKENLLIQSQLNKETLTKMVQKPSHNSSSGTVTLVTNSTTNGNGNSNVNGISNNVSNSGSGSVSSVQNTTSVMELNVSNPHHNNTNNHNNSNNNYLYYMMSSGQFSPCDTLDSGTGSDLESNGQQTQQISPNLNGKKASLSSNSSTTSSKSLAPLELHLQSTKIRVDNSNANTLDMQPRQCSFTDSEESEASSLSCDSLHSNEFLRQSSTSPLQIKSPSTNGSKKIQSFLPDSLLREIKNLKFSSNDYEAENEAEEEEDILPTLKSSKKSDIYNEELPSNKQDYIKSHEFMQSRKNLNNLPPIMSSSLKRASLPSKTFVLNTEDGTFIDTKMNSMPRTYEADKYYNFHVNEHDNFRSFGNNGSISPLENGSDSLSITNFETKSLHDDVFAGYRDLRCGSNTSTIRSSKGTVRGVKNRVRNGIATFLQLQQPNMKNYKEKDSGKVVLYTTSMGIIRDTYAKCSNVKQILRTLLVKFEERDVFMSVEYQQEIKERMHSDIIKVPQLYVEGQHIGDADTVERLNESGELRQLLKPYKSISTTYTCQTCGGYRLLPCPSCNGSKKSVHRNHFTAEFVALKCMNCDEVGLVKCHNC